MKTSKIANRTISILLIFSILIGTVPLLNLSVHAVSDGVEKVYCTASLEDSFADNKVIIVLMPQYNEEEYTAEDFSDINCIATEELSIDPEKDAVSRIIQLTLAEHSKQNVLNAVSILEQRQDIYSAEPNYILESQIVFDDPAYQNGLQWAIDRIDLPRAWEISSGSPNIYVGIIDSGIDGYHEDLDTVDPFLSKNFVDNTLPWVDTIGHGTKVASVIGAVTDNSIGMSGVCEMVQLVSLKVVNAYGQVSVDDAVAAVEYAQEKGIWILNFSIGKYTSMSSLKIAIQNYSGLFICSAGNDGYNTDEISHYPSEYSFLPNVISVGASSMADTRWVSADGSRGSNYGLASVDIFAPGENIYCCEAGGGYATATGTSLAAPFVTGVAVLIAAEYPDLSASEIKDRILDYAEPVCDANGNSVFGDICYSGCRLNAYYALLG